MNKKLVTVLSIVGVLAIAIISCTVCPPKNSEGTGNADATSTQIGVNAPLNISVFLDLSDRIIRDMTPSQMSRDTAIIGYITDYYKAQTQGKHILDSKNAIKVFFYPAPNIPGVEHLADQLQLDMSVMPKSVDRRVRLESLKTDFQNSLAQIYEQTLSSAKYPGCDIWDFFSSKKVDDLCIRDGYRNILIVVTDGYLFDEKHKVQEGNAYSFVTASTLKNPNSSLIVKRDGLDNLEVIMLEVNPLDINHRNHLIEVLETWLTGMGIKAENMKIAETELPTNTKTILDKFLNK